MCVSVLIVAIKHKSRGHVGGKAAMSSDLLVVPSQYLFRQWEKIRSTERCWPLKPPLFWLRKLMSDYLGDIIPFFQMCRSYYLAKCSWNCPTFQKLWEEDGKDGVWQMDRVKAGTHTCPSWSLFTWMQENECIPSLIRDGEEALGGLREQLYIMFKESCREDWGFLHCGFDVSHWTAVVAQTCITSCLLSCLWQWSAQGALGPKGWQVLNAKLYRDI